MESRPAILPELKRSLGSLLGDQLVSMVLFGSMARGDYHDKSEVDVAVIVRGLTRKLKGQILFRSEADKVIQKVCTYLKEKAYL